MKQLFFITPSGVLLLASIALSACHRDESAAPVVRPVVAMTVEGNPELAAISVSGEIVPRYRTNLSFRVSGNIADRKVRLGDTVKAGQVLANLDPSDFNKNASVAREQLEIAEQHLSLAKSQVERDRQQAHENLIPAAQLEQTETNYAAIQAQARQAQQQLALATNQLHYAVLVADRDGVISAEMSNTGDNVSAGQSVFQLAWSKEVDAVADVSESTLAAIVVGTKATVTLPSMSGVALDAAVREIAPEADPGSRTFKIKLTVNPAQGLRLGSTAQITFHNPEENNGASQFTIPSTALFHDGQRPAVWVVLPNNTLTLRPINIKRYTESTVLVSDGLARGERVVTQGVHTVSAGQLVQPVALIHEVTTRDAASGAKP